MQSSHVARWQAALVGGAALLLGIAIRYPDVEHRPAPPRILFCLLLYGVPIGLAFLGFVGVRRDRSRWTSHVLSTLGLCVLWLYAAFFLWVNTYGE